MTNHDSALQLVTGVTPLPMYAEIIYTSYSESVYDFELVMTFVLTKDSLSWLVMAGYDKCCSARGSVR